MTKLETDWLTLWSSKGAHYNCSTSTFDIGYVQDGSADAYIAVSNQSPYLIRQIFHSTDVYSVCHKPRNATSTREIARSFWGGAWIDALHRICEGLLLRCKIYEPIANEDVIGGSPVLRDVMSGQAAFGVSPLLITQSRYNSNNYSIISSPINKSYSMLLNQAFLHLETKGTDEIIKDIFGPLVWSLIAATISILLVALILSQKVNPDSVNSPSWERIVWESFHGVITSSFSGRFMDLGIGVSTTITVLILLIFSLVICSLFNAMIPMQLSISQQTVPPFTSVSAFLKTDFKIYGASATVEAMADNKDWEIQQVANRTTPFPDHVRDFYEFITENLDERATYLVSKEGYWMLAFMKNFNCNVIEAVSDVKAAPMGMFWFRKSDVKLRMEVETRFNRLVYTGFFEFNLKRFQRILRDEMYKKGISLTCFPSPYPRHGLLGQHGLTLDEFAFVFLTLLIVFTIASLVLLLERLVFRMKGKQF